MKQNKIAGFWIRLAARVFDLFIFSGLIILLTYFLLEKTDGKLQFKIYWKFYVWNLISIFLLVTLFIFIPLIFNGQTIGMFVFCIKIIFNDENKKIMSLIKRELFFSLVWFFNLLILLITINHTLINKLILQKEASYSVFESLRIGIFTSFGSILFLIQWIFAFSVMVKKDKIGIHDHISNSKTVYKYKFQMINITSVLFSFEPFMIKNKKVEWIRK